MGEEQAMKEKESGGNRGNVPPERGKDVLSPAIRQVLETEASEAEIQAAIDAAREEGLTITREEAIKVLRKSPKKSEG